MTKNQLVTGFCPFNSPKASAKYASNPKNIVTEFPKAATTRVTQPLFLIHSDLCGPLPTPALDGSKYIMTLTHDFSWVFLLKSKGEAFDTFKVFKCQLENQFPFKLSCLHTDWGGEYMSDQFSQFLKTQGIRTQLNITRVLLIRMGSLTSKIVLSSILSKVCPFNLAC